MTPERSGLSPSTRNAFAAIEAYIVSHGCSPSYDDIKRAMGIVSKGFVHRLVNDLVARGWITYTPGKKRSIAIVPAMASPLQLPAHVETALKRYCARRGLLPAAVIADAVAERIGLRQMDRAA
jgi:SOS-response transcriptional repressor LexA